MNVIKNDSFYILVYVYEMSTELYLPIHEKQNKIDCPSDDDEPNHDKVDNVNKPNGTVRRRGADHKSVLLHLFHANND